MSVNYINKNIEILKKFSKQADKLSKEKYQQLNKFGISFNFYQTDSNVNNNFPDEEILESFLINVRMFIMVKSGNEFNFEKICQFFIYNNFQSEKVKEWLDAYKKLFEIEIIPIKTNDKILTTRMVFNTILNEDNFHKEKEQKGMKYLLSSPIIESFSRFKFLDTVSRLRMLICAFNVQIVKKYLEEYDK